MTAPLPSTDRVCQICGVVMPTRGFHNHLRGHGLTRTSSEADIAEAVRVARRIRDHQRRRQEADR